MKFTRSLALASVAILAAGCEDTPPQPTATAESNYKATRMAVTPVNQQLEIDGCRVKVHRVTTAGGDHIQAFTLAVATCPTSTVTSVEHNCGKNCSANNIIVQPVTGAPPRAEPAPEAESAREMRLQEARLNELRAQVEKLSADMELRKKSVGP